MGEVYRKQTIESVTVPEHERCYLGDMDTRDSGFQRILYTDDKREA